MHRRQFLRQTATTASLLSAGMFPMQAIARPKTTSLTILHTNDVHSRIDPFPMDGSRNEGLGGVARRSKLIQQIRAQEPNVLLLDSGDIFQGTPYFNFFAGELEIKLMSEMGYDATTIGNHDFDAGIDGLLKQLPHATFPFVTCNYDFDHTVLREQTKPYQVFEKGGVKIGVLGVGIALKGLVPEKLYADTRYLDPVTQANQVADKLRYEEKCDYIICLSHLGYKYQNEQIDDIKFARSSRNIDLILGGHTHTFMPQPDIIPNTENKPVMINQVGWAGILLGRVDVSFEKNRKNRCVTCQNLIVR
ncbi:MAG: metallophosphatase [Saprospiraceae bacterium]|nr:metallophosphatase [Saprospiraceae bacterium]